MHFACRLAFTAKSQSLDDHQRTLNGKPRRRPTPLVKLLISAISFNLYR
jgi:hypothetical protein